MPWSAPIHRARPAPAQNVQQPKRESAAARGYDHRWRRYAKRFLKLHPLCAECEKRGETTAAEVVDHLIPHKGNMILFWDPTNHQPLCKRDHDVKTAREDGGFGRAVTHG
jgi:5-methylcytosine-specific restriction protein A